MTMPAPFILEISNVEIKSFTSVNLGLQNVSDQSRIITPPEVLLLYNSHAGNTARWQNVYKRGGRGGGNGRDYCLITEKTTFNDIYRLLLCTMKTCNNCILIFKPNLVTLDII